MCGSLLVFTDLLRLTISHVRACVCCTSAIQCCACAVHVPYSAVRIAVLCVCYIGRANAMQYGAYCCTVYMLYRMLCMCCPVSCITVAMVIMHCPLVWLLFVYLVYRNYNYNKCLGSLLMYFCLSSLAQAWQQVLLFISS